MIEKLKVNPPTYPIDNYEELKEKDKLQLAAEGILTSREIIKSKLQKEMEEFKLRFSFIGSMAKKAKCGNSNQFQLSLEHEEKFH